MAEVYTQPGRGRTGLGEKHYKSLHKLIDVIDRVSPNVSSSAGLPKEHIDEFCDLSDEISGKIITLANKLSKNIKLHLKPKRVGLAVHGLGVPHAHLIVVPLHEPNDIVSSRHAYLENGEIKFSEKHLPITSRNELNRLARLISN